MSLARDPKAPKPEPDQPLEARVDCPSCSQSYILPLDGDESRRCPHCGAPTAPPDGVLIVRIPGGKALRGELVAQLRNMAAEAKTGTPRKKAIEALIAGVAIAPWRRIK